MSEKDLQDLAPVFKAMPAEEVEAPDMPVANVVQEANDLYVLLNENDPIRTRLVKVGLEESTVPALRQATGALQEAQSRWRMIRSGKKGKAQRQLEARANARKLDLLAACRWNLRKDDKASATVSAISEGDGTADLVQDLNDLATLMGSRLAAFTTDETFDADEAIAEARRLAQEVRQGTSEERAEQARGEAKDLRDKAFTHLSDLVDDVREAGRYAYRGDEAKLAAFQSRYLRRRRTRARNRRSSDETPVPVGETDD